jgi:hypothetical protein
MAHFSIQDNMVMQGKLQISGDFGLTLENSISQKRSQEKSFSPSNFLKFLLLKFSEKCRFRLETMG